MYFYMRVNYLVYSGKSSDIKTVLNTYGTDFIKHI